MDQNNPNQKPNFQHIIFQTQKSKFASPFVFVPILAIVALIAGFSVYFYVDKSQNVDSKESVNLQKLLKKVGEHIILPPDEEPTVATVSDPEKIRNQPFFTNTKEGDRLLIYLQARRAYLYRPSEDKLVEVAPLNSNNTISNGSSGLSTTTSN